MIKNLNCDSSTENTKQQRMKNIISGLQIRLKEKSETRKEKNRKTKNRGSTLRKKRRNNISSNMVPHLQINKQ